MIQEVFVQTPSETIMEIMNGTTSVTRFQGLSGPACPIGFTPSKGVRPHPQRPQRTQHGRAPL